MAEIFKFFNSAPGDERWHYASDFADYFGSVLSSGLISNGEAVGLQATVNSGTMTTSVAIGKALIKGYSYENTTPLTLTHSIPEQTLDRIDRVVLRLDLKNASRFIRVFIKEGVSALEPIPPTLQRDQYIYELSLAQVRIRKNTSSIVVSDIKDERADENLCGIVQSLITVPTSVFQQQFDVWFASIADVTEQSVYDWQIAQQQAFTLWFESIKGQLDGDVGAKLASDLATHQADLAHVHWIGTAVGTNTLTATYEAITTLKNGLGVAFLNTTSSTLATTLNINGLGAIPILKANGNPVTNLKANGIYTIRYANGNFILQGEGGEYGTATASDVLAGKTIGTENGIVQGTLTFSKIQAGATNKLINFTSQRVLGWPYSTYTTYKKLQMKYTGSIRLNINISTYNSMNSTCGYKLLKNGVSIKQTEQKNNISETFDFSISKLDIIELQLYSTERDKIVINTEIFSCDVIYNDGIIVDLTTLISEVA